MTSVQLPPELADITNLLDNTPEHLALGDPAIQAAALRATKFVFDLALQTEHEAQPHVDALLSSLTPEEAPLTRSQAHATRKRKRTPSPHRTPQVAFAQTALTTLFTDGLEADQIWAQMDLRAKNICDLLQLALEGGPDEAEGQDLDDGRLQSIMQSLQDGEDVGLDGIDLEGLTSSEESGESEETEDVSVAESESEDGEEQLTDLRDPSPDDDDDGTPPSMLDMIRPKPSTKSSKYKAHPELNDGFFDLASFNAETEEAESKTVSKGALGRDDGDESDDDASVDLFAPIDVMENYDENDSQIETGEAFYKDFFVPPRTAAMNARLQLSSVPHKKPGTVRFHEEVRVKKIKANGKNLPLSTVYDDDRDDEDSDLEQGEMDADRHMDYSEEGEEEEESEHESELNSDETGGRMAIERMKDDLFADDDQAPTLADRSMHEQRLAALQEQIATLEHENVAKKDWVLMGEATSRSRPQNSLLEEDLEFERAMKAVPVITEDKVMALEDRIKARILEGRFDDVVRLRPADEKPFLPSRFFELQDTKSKQSLAQIYESEYVAATGGSTGDDRDNKLKKEHNDIENLWEAICSKLDALCNAHFVPKQPKAVISTVANVSTATLESALPTVKSISTLLAPEEIFAPSSTDLRARSELTPAEKRAQRSKTRKARQKTHRLLGDSVDQYRKVKDVKKQKQAALKTVVKSGKGITVVGKKNKDILRKGSHKALHS